MAPKTNEMLSTTGGEQCSVEIPKFQEPTFQPQDWELYFSPESLKKMGAEMIATFMLVFATAGSAALSASDEHQVSKLGASVAGGLIITVMIYAVGHVSGAHMNPAVTIGFAASRHFPWKLVPFYIASQLTGAISAGFALRIILHPLKDLGTTTPSGSDVQALLMETIVTFSMMLVASAVATDAKAVGELAGVAVGSAVCITSIIAGPISGGSMNPARTLGPAIASNNFHGVWVYLAGPVLGTLMGAWSYNLIRVTDDPHRAVSPHSSSFKLRRMKNEIAQFPTADSPNPV